MGIFNTKSDSKSSDGKSSISKAAKKDETKPSMKELYGGESPAKKTETAAVRKNLKRGQAYRLLVRPLVTEKASIMGSENKYLFEVSKEANKVEIAKAIDDTYGVKPIAVNIINVLGKKTRYGKIKGQRKDWKKAIVQLPAGKTIKVYEGV